MKNGMLHILDEYMDPWAVVNGYERQDTVFRYRSPNGDWLVFDFQKSTSRAPGIDCFFINVGVVPALWWKWRTVSGDLAEAPSASDGLVWSRLADPSRAKPDSMWLVSRDQGSVEDAGRAVLQILSMRVVDGYQKLLDRADLLRSLNNETIDAIDVQPTVLRLVLLAEAGPSERLRAATTEFAERKPNLREFADWIWREASDAR